jgi:hypothetical protein
MPRVSDNATEEQATAPKRARARSAARKPATKRTTTARKSTARVIDGEKKPRAPRKRTTKKPAAQDPDVRVDEPEVEFDGFEESSGRNRKAPTKFAAQTKQQKTKRVQYAVVVTLLVVGIGASAAVGVTDAGRIDVAQTIQDHLHSIPSPP